MHATTVAIDLAKDVFELAIADEQWVIRKRQRLTRSDFTLIPDSLPPCRVVMEACASAHYWARRFRQAGHEPILLPAQYVRPYRRRNKTDRNDAAAILQAARDRDILPVPIKAESQQAIMGLHRIRSAWMATRTARINLIRGLLKEFGITLRPGSNIVIRAAREALSDDTIAPVLSGELGAVLDEIRDIEARIDRLEKQLKATTKQDPAVQRLLEIPGAGLLTATALAASAGDAKHFRSGRHMAAWLGLTPREFSSGNNRTLGRISKRGDVYLRTLLVHGARTALLQAQRSARTQPDRLSRLQQWAVDLNARVGHNKAAVALANKMARTAWAIWAHDRSFNGSFAAA